MLSGVILALLTWFVSTQKFGTGALYTTALGVGLLCALNGYILGNLFGSNSPWLYTVYILPFVSVAYSVDILERSLFAFMFGGLYAVGYIGATGYPQQFGYFIQLSLAFSGISIVFGHVLFLVDRDRYLTSRALAQQKQKSKRLASRDPLTNLYNRRELTNILTRNIEATCETKTPLTIMLIDLDDFKTVNDTYGHQCGDYILKQVADVLQNSIRCTDYAFRYGGDEFFLLLPETTKKRAKKVAKRLKEKISTIDLPVDDSDYTVGASVGIAQYEPDEDQTQLLNRADSKLYRAKRRKKQKNE